MKKWVIGDIRGDLYLLKKLIDRIAPGEKDTLIFLGSYLGPGKDSKGVIDYLLDLRKKPGEFVFLRGCYEYLFRYCIGENVPLDKVGLWSQMGGGKVFQSYTAKEKIVVMSPPNGHPSRPTPVEIPLLIPEPHIRFLERDLSLMFRDDVLPFIACHNGYYAGVAGGDIPEEYSVFTPKGWESDDRFQIPGKEIIFSHIPSEKLEIKPGKINLDLGAGIGGRLAAMEMYERKFAIAAGGGMR